MIDKRALNILLEYDMLNPEKTSPEDLRYAKAAGLMFDKIKMNHSEVISWAIKEYQSCTKSSVVNKFLCGFEKNMTHKRAALSAYALMTHFPDHAFTPFSTGGEYIYCKICALMSDNEYDLSFLNSCRWECGAVISREPIDLAFNLNQHNKEILSKPTELDIDRFISVLEIIAADKADTPIKILKKLKKHKEFGFNEDQFRYLLDTLGYCGILQSNSHPGYIYKFTADCDTVSKSRSSDWGYPVDYWTGSDGINKDAMDYWFSEFPKIKNWTERHLG